MNLVQALELKRLLRSKLCKGCILSDGLLMRDSRGLFGHSRSTGCMMPTIWLEWLQTWRRIIGNSDVDNLVSKPDDLSFYIRSKILVSEFTRQQLLEIHGTSYRLQKEIQLLEQFDIVLCKICQTLIARRSDMVVMSSGGPLNAYANARGYVHEVMTLYNASGLMLFGLPSTEHRWFPGYAWTIASCASCGSLMGWCFTAARKKLKPRSFWGIRSSQVAEEHL